MVAGVPRAIWLRVAVSLTIAALLLAASAVMVWDSERDPRPVIHKTSQPWERGQ